MYGEAGMLLLAAAAIIVGSVVQRASGVGGGFLIVPILAMIDTAYLPGPLVFATIALSTLMAWREWQYVDFSAIPGILVGFVPGTAVGAWLLSVVAPDRLGVVFGSVILLAVLITGLGMHPPATRPIRALVGAISGVMGASSGIGAPPLALLYQRQSGAVLRATLAVLYTICSVLILLMLAAFGDFGSREALLGLALTPGFFVGYLLGAPLVKFVDRSGVRWVVLLVSAAAAVALIVKSF